MAELDPIHIYTHTCRLPANPGTWSLCFGVDYGRLAAAVDYGAAHLYQNMASTWDPASASTCGWDCESAWFGRWLDAHIAAPTGKPFVLEEYGQAWSEAQRNQLFTLVRERLAAAKAAAPASPAAGAMFWGATVDVGERQIGGPVGSPFFQ